MAAKVIWSATSLADLECIATYIARDKPDAAAKLVQSILDAGDNFALFPSLGKPVIQFKNTTYREFVVRPCRIFYRTEDHAIFIVRILRGEQRLTRKRIKQADNPTSP